MTGSTATEDTEGTEDGPRRVPTATAAPDRASGTAAPGITDERGERNSAERMFSTSVVVSGVRCLIAYVLLPWVAPALGVGQGVGPQLGLAITAVAVVFNVASIRRFQRSGHRWRWAITAINLSVIALLAVLTVNDIAALT